jgi:hypothetical protein
MGRFRFFRSVTVFGFFVGFFNVGSVSVFQKTAVFGSVFGFFRLNTVFEYYCDNKT